MKTTKTDWLPKKRLKMLNQRQEKLQYPKITFDLRISERADKKNWMARCECIDYNQNSNVVSGFGRTKILAIAASAIQLVKECPQFASSISSAMLNELQNMQCADYQYRP